MDEAIVTRAASEAGVGPSVIASVEKRKAFMGRLLDTLSSSSDATGITSRAMKRRTVSMSSARISGGVVVMVALYERPPEPDLNLLIRKELRLVGSLGMDAGDFAQSFRWLEEGAVRLVPMISHEIPLERVAEAYELAGARTGAVKVMVVPKAHELSRTEVDKLEDTVKQLGGKGLVCVWVGEDGVSWM